MNNEQLPAYPAIISDEDGHFEGSYNGMSKLEAFTMAAIQGLCSNPAMVGKYGPTENELETISGAAVTIARATLTELSKHQ